MGAEDDELEGALAERLIRSSMLMMEIAHDGRNAIQRGFIAIRELEQRSETGDLGPCLARLEDAFNELDRLHASIRDYLGPVELCFESCELTEIITRAWTDLATPRRGRDAQLEISGGEAWCRADGQALRRVIRNLLDNALAVAPDPLHIAAEIAVDDRLGRPGLRLRVCDNGPGLPEEQTESIFDAFYTGRAAGTGLGLNVARRLVQAHGGELGARPGGPGAQFELYLPLSPELGAKRLEPLHSVAE